MELDLAYEIGGRPYPRGLHRIDVSPARADGLIAVGVGRDGRIGVDAERHDLGLDSSRDTAARTMLDECFMGAVSELVH